VTFGQPIILDSAVSKQVEQWAKTVFRSKELLSRLWQDCEMMFHDRIFYIIIQLHFPCKMIL
jgi:hypothetical protein